MEFNSGFKGLIQAPLEGGQGPEGVVATWMDG